MAQWVGAATVRRPLPWWLQLLYALLVASALSLVTLVAAEVYSALEGPEQQTRFASIVDLASFVFLPTTVATLAGAMTASIGGRFGHSSALTRYSVRATAYLALATGVVVVIALLEA